MSEELDKGIKMLEEAASLTKEELEEISRKEEEVYDKIMRLFY